MLRLGAVLALFGFGSAVLYFMDRHIAMLAWADEWQPSFGLILGGVGVVLLLIGSLRNRDDAPEPPGYGPGQPPIPQYSPRPPQGPPPPRGPVQDFGPQGGPPFGPQGR
jgi:hypothetical protein